MKIFMVAACYLSALLLRRLDPYRAITNRSPGSAAAFYLTSANGYLSLSRDL
jgi:hypothetical protein